MLILSVVQCVPCVSSCVCLCVDTLGPSFIAALTY